MKRVLISVMVLLALGAGALLIWRYLPSGHTYFTDADTIREPAATARVRDVLWEPPVLLEDSINAGGETYEPRLSNDATALYFVRGKAGENADIYISKRDAQGWAAPQAFAEINSTADDLGPVLSADGRQLFFYSNRAGGLGGYDLWVSVRGADGEWREPANLGPDVNSAFNDYGPALTTDGGTLYFSSNRPLPDDDRQPDPAAWSATLREEFFTRTYDLYSAPLSESGAGVAVPLAGLNTPHNEGAPAISPFGDFLYFASDRPAGSGGFDLYRSWLIRGQLQPAENLGSAVNTVHHDLDPALSMNGFGLDFSSNRPLPGEEQARSSPYRLYHTNSREVFRDTEYIERPSVDWAALWRAIGPNLLWALLALALLLLMLLFFKGAQNRKLSLLAKCVLASLAAHLLMMMLFNVWEVAASIAGEIQKGGALKVALIGTPSHSIAAQITGSLTQIDQPEWTETSSRAKPPVEAIAPVPEFSQPLMRIEMPAGEKLPTRVELTEVQLTPDAPAVAQINFTTSVSKSEFRLNTPENVAAVQTSEAAGKPTTSMKATTPRASLDSDVPSLDDETIEELIPRPSMIQGNEVALVSNEERIVESHVAAQPAASQPTPTWAPPAVARVSVAAVMPGAPARPMEESQAMPLKAGSALPATQRISSSGPNVDLSETEPSPVPSNSAIALKSSDVASRTSAREAIPTPSPASSKFEPDLANALPAASKPSVALSLPAAEQAPPQPVRNEEHAPSASSIAFDSTRATISNLMIPEARSDRNTESLVPARRPLDLAPMRQSATTPAVAQDSVIQSATTRNDPSVSVPVPTSTPIALNLQLPDETAPPEKVQDKKASAVLADSSDAPGKDEPIGIIRGKVADQTTRTPLTGAQVRLVLSGRKTLTAITDESGRYELVVPPTPDHFALSASHDEFLPGTVSLERDRLEARKSLTVNFLLEPQNPMTTATETAPDVHHLGDDRFSGDINSQFQKRSEGSKFITTFDIAPEQLGTPLDRAELRLMAKGVQRRHKIYINGSLLDTRLDYAPEDGSFGEFAAPFPAELLVGGSNTLKIAALPSDDDIDDFEFVNIRIYLVPAADRPSSTATPSTVNAGPSGTQ